MRFFPQRGETLRFVGRRWRWKKDPPLAFRLLYGAFVVNFLAGWLLLWTIGFWASETPNERQPVPVRLRGGVIYYAGPVEGHFVNSFMPVTLAIAVMLGVVASTSRDELERVD
jgi:hypothetical protein